MIHCYHYYLLIKISLLPAVLNYTGAQDSRRFSKTLSLGEELTILVNPPPKFFSPALNSRRLTCVAKPRERGRAHS